MPVLTLPPDSVWQWPRNSVPCYLAVAWVSVSGERNGVPPRRRIMDVYIVRFVATHFDAPISKWGMPPSYGA